LSNPDCKNCTNFIGCDKIDIFAEEFSDYEGNCNDFEFLEDESEA
jgi:hypothetical protein